MNTKPNLLIVGDYSRPDYINLFKSCFEDFNLYFLHFSSQKELDNTGSSYYKKYGQAIFWGDYDTAYSLLKQINPDKVIYIFIESYHQVLLNVVCRIKGICTYLIDHGIRDVNANIRLEKYLFLQYEQIRPYPLHLKLSQFYPRIKTRLFLLNTIRRLPVLEKKFIKNYIRVRKKNNWADTFKKIRSPLRLPDVYISFSPKTFEVHQYYDHLGPETKVFYIGIPFFDHLANIKPTAPEKNILFIDQGLAERGLFGWTMEKYGHLQQQLSAIADFHGYNLYLKPHPRQKSFSGYDNITVINDDDLAHLLPKTPLVIGFTSTYLLPLIAQPYTTVLTLENHPVGRLDVSKTFIDAGVACPVYDPEELNHILPDIEQLHRQQLPNKTRFIKDWMYKFDGKAGERLRDILLSDGL